MKANTKKLLMWLYPAAGQKRRVVPASHFTWLLPDLTQSGLRSLIRLLEKKQLLFVDEITAQKRLMISSYGQDQLKAEFLVFERHNDSWSGDWTQILFLQAPSSDPNFRYLRSLLLKNWAFSLKRGVYLFPGQLPAKVQETLREAYRGSVLVVQIGQWQFGDEHMIIGQQVHLQDRVNLYSGISEEIELLLTKFEKNKRLTRSIKKEICSIYDRLFQSLAKDRAVISHYFPEASSGIELLALLQSTIETDRNREKKS